MIELARVNGAAVANLADLACKVKHANPCNVIYTYGPFALDWALITGKFFTSTVKAKYPNMKIIATGLNNFAPTIMIGERAAAFVLGAGPPRSTRASAPVVDGDDVAA